MTKQSLGGLEQGRDELRAAHDALHLARSAVLQAKYNGATGPEGPSSVQLGFSPAWDNAARDEIRQALVAVDQALTFVADAYAAARDNVKRLQDIEALGATARAADAVRPTERRNHE